MTHRFVPECVRQQVEEIIRTRTADVADMLWLMHYGHEEDTTELLVTDLEEVQYQRERLAAGLPLGILCIDAD